METIIRTLSVHERLFINELVIDSLLHDLPGYF